MIFQTFILRGAMLGFFGGTNISPNNLHEPASYHEVGTDDELFDNSVVYWEMKSQFTTVLQNNKNKEKP